MDSLQNQQILSEQRELQLFAHQRQEKFQQSLEAYLNHIKKQTEQLQASQPYADSRNQQISEVFEGVYERIMMGSQILIRKAKETSFEKKIFWENLIASNADMSDLELKKDFYQQKRDAEDIYYDAIEAQKMKKIPYADLLGKIKSDHSLKHWQDNNKKFEQKVNQGTKTLHQWKMFEEKPRKEQPYYGSDSSHFLHQFTQPENTEWTKPAVVASRYTNNQDEGRRSYQEDSVLKDFYHRKI